MSAPTSRRPSAVGIAAKIHRRGLEREEGVLYIRRRGIERAERLRLEDVVLLADTIIDLELRCRLVDLEPWERTMRKLEAKIERLERQR